MQFPPIGGQISRSDRPKRRSCSAIPPLSGVGASVWSVVVAKVQTHKVTSTQKRRFWLNGSALWRIHCLALLVALTDFRPPRGLPAREPSAPRASLGASSRSPSRPSRPRGGLLSVGLVVRELPALALPPPTGAAARPRRPRGGLLSVGACRLCVTRPGPMRDSRRVRRA